jgi:glycosyltransferase involved in cell wall biosynthesis
MAERPLNVLVLASKPMGLSPSQRFRLEQWAPLLERDHRIRLDFAPFESDALARIVSKPGKTARKAVLVARDFVRRSAIVARAKSYDAIVIHREAALLGPAIYERLLPRTGKPLIFDFDDSIWMQQPDQRNSVFSLLHFHRKTKTICALASAVSAGNEYLADYARSVNSNVHVVPTTIEMADYEPRPEPPDEPFVVCWTGSTTTLPHFEHARGALEQAARRLPMIVKIICNKPPELPVAGAKMQFIPWSPAVEGPEISASHVGIMPLPDNEFSRGKCGLKALQCMAAARPVIASDVGVNGDIIRPGKNGFLAATPAEFTEAIIALATSPELRARLGAAARQTVERDYSAPVGAAKFASVVRSVV